MTKDNKAEKIKNAITEIMAVLEERSSGKRKSFQHNVSVEALEYLELTLPQFSSNLALRFLDDANKRKALSDHLHEYFNNLPKDELLKELVNSTIKAEISAEMAQFAKSQADFYKAKYEEAQKNKLQSHKNRLLGKAAIFKTNNDCLDACFEAISKKLKRNLCEEDFPAFKSFVLEKFPKRPFEQKPRTKQEIKKLSPERQREEEDEVRNKGWPNSTLYNFFNKKLSTVK